MRKPLIIGCDNAAVDLKNVVIGVLKEQQIPFEDVGVDARMIKLNIRLLPRKWLRRLWPATTKKKAF
jgi:hypothetical protein